MRVTATIEVDDVMRQLTTQEKYDMIEKIDLLARDVDFTLNVISMLSKSLIDHGEALREEIYEAIEERLRLK